MKLPARTLRWRLTLWYVGILTGTLILFSIGVYTVMARQFSDAEDDALRNLGLLLDSQIADQGGRLSLPASDQTAKSTERFVRLYDAAGRSWFDTSDTVGPVPILQRSLDQAARGSRRYETLTVDSQHVRVLSMPVQRAGTTIGVLQLGHVLDEEDRALNRMLLVLALGIPLTVAVVGWGGAFLAGRALAPIDSLTRAAQRISTLDLSQRIEMPLRDDELGRLAATFDMMSSRLDQAFRQQRQFTADASHELRTPLTAIRGQIDVALSRARTGKEYREVLQHVLGQTERMSRLVSDMLTLARSEADALHLQCERLDAAQVLGDVGEAIEAEASERQVRLVVCAPAPVWVLADEDRLLQVLFNLTTNALAHTPAGGTITLACRAEAMMAEIKIHDSGPGIAPEHLPRIFDRFYRIDTARTRASGGAGLGLAIAQSIVAAHGGSITVHSDEGKGATFLVRLPLHPEG